MIKNAIDCEVGPDEPSPKMEDCRDCRIEAKSNRVSVECCGTDPPPRDFTVSPQINFTHSLTYAEQLLVDKNRNQKLLPKSSYFKLTEQRETELTDGNTIRDQGYFGLRVFADFAQAFRMLLSSNALFDDIMFIFRNFYQLSKYL